MFHCLVALDQYETILTGPPGRTVIELLSINIDSLV